AAQAHAYAPYSHFRVGAALEAEDGRVFAGCNVENASYGLTICAERAALASAVTQGARRFRRIVVVSDTDPPAAPCGACRQVLSEFGANLPVEGVGRTTRARWTVGELLPAAFGPGSLA
ncbi:MAG TPA: cytidine deaminase, partial [Gemmatimonadales bacterium]|nr:cytidine deaminase [Gemmatimonadales bacterium]